MNFVALLENLSTRRKQQTKFAIRTLSNTREREKLSPAAAVAAGIEPKTDKSGEWCSAPFALLCEVFQRPTYTQRTSAKSKQMWSWDWGE
jgi:hypothetical protein